MLIGFTTARMRQLGAGKHAVMGMIFVATMLDADALAAARSSPEAWDELVENESGDEERSVDVDKAWHAIHFLLAGCPDVDPSAPSRSRRWFARRREQAVPAVGAESLAVLGGEPVGEDAGYGPARLLTPDQVADVAAALEPLDRETLGRRVDLAAMDAAELYPRIWDEADVYEEYVGPNYEQLRAFYLRAAAAGAAVVLSIR